MDFLRKKNGERKGRKGGEVLSGDDGGYGGEQPVGAFPGDPAGGSFYAPSPTGGAGGGVQGSAGAMKSVRHAFLCYPLLFPSPVCSFRSTRTGHTFLYRSWLLLPS